MANSFAACNHEVDDVHRWLPSEILRDIGIVDDPAAEGRRLAAVEDLATRLAGVLLGSAKERTPQHHLVVPPPARSASANSYQRHHAPPPVEVRPLIVSNDGKMVNLLTPVAPPSFSQAMRPPLLVATSVLPPPPPAKRPSGAGGTGVFLPRAEAYSNHKSRMPEATARSAGVKPPRHAKRQQCRSRQQQRRQEEEEAAMRSNRLPSWKANPNDTPPHASAKLELPWEWESRRSWC